MGFPGGTNTEALTQQGELTSGSSRAPRPAAHSQGISTLAWVQQRSQATCWPLILEGHPLGKHNPSILHHLEALPRSMMGRGLPGPWPGALYTGNQMPSRPVFPK